MSIDRRGTPIPKTPPVLGIVGSPRRGGNTHLLVERILQGAAAAGRGTELVFLGDLRIRECDGCHTCWRGKPCSKRDDMNALYPRIIGSAGLVLGTPVYWYGPTGLMKIFMDRMVYFNCPENRARIRGKRAVLVVPFEEEGIRTADLLVKFFRKSLDYLEMPLAGKILVPGVTRRGEVREKPERLAECYALGKSLALGRITTERRGDIR